MPWEWVRSRRSPDGISRWTGTGAGIAPSARTRRSRATGDGVAADAVAYIEAQYAAGVTDEFVPPVSILNDGRRIRIEDGDSIIFFNFRPDRARQLSHALVDADFDGFSRSRVLRDVELVTFTEYERDLDARVAFPREDVLHTLAEEVSAAGLRQFHVAETEKYAHVTYFINGGRETRVRGRGALAGPVATGRDLRHRPGDERRAASPTR